MTTVSIIGSATSPPPSAPGRRRTATPSSVRPRCHKARALADQIRNGATVGTFGATPRVTSSSSAVPYQSVVEVVAHYGDALTEKILVDITNPVNADASGLATAPGSSMSQQIAAAAPESADVVKGSTRSSPRPGS